MNSNKDKNELPDFHDKVNYKTGFKVPDNYFENFSDKMVSILDKELDRKIIKLSVWEKMNNWISSIGTIPKLAVSFASLLLVIAIGMNYYTSGTDLDFMAINAEDAYEYIVAHSDDMELEELYSLDIEDIDILEISEIEAEEYLEDILEDIDDEMMEDFIM